MDEIHRLLKQPINQIRTFFVNIIRHILTACP